MEFKDKIKSNENYILDDVEKDSLIKELEPKFKEIFETMGFDINNDIQMNETPKRVAKMYVNELFSGTYGEEPKITVFENTRNYDEMVFLGPITVKSLCGHHFLPFTGKAYIAYIPGDYVTGISKLSRIVRWFMRRPQIQEELTKQIGDYIVEKLQPIGAAVYIEAQHQCMIVRGVEEYNSWMKTSDLRGVFLNKPEVRTEFFSMVTNNR